MNKKTVLVAKETFILSWKKLWYVISFRAECVKTKVHQPLLEKKNAIGHLLSGRVCIIRIYCQQIHNEFCAL